MVREGGEHGAARRGNDRGERGRPTGVARVCDSLEAAIIGELRAKVCADEQQAAMAGAGGGGGVGDGSTAVRLGV